MASNFKIATTARNAACNAVADALDAGNPVAATIQIRTGSPPADPQQASSGTLLATCTMSLPAYGSASVGVCQENTITSDTNADASGDAGHFRVFADTTCILQGTAGEAADTPDLTFDDKSIVAGGTVAITDFSLTMPEGGS